MTTLVIVESPNKVRSIAGYLGDGYVVDSSVGHIRDLPKGADQVPAKYKGESWARLGVTYDDDANNQQTTDALLGRVTTELDNYQCSPGNARWNLSRTSRVEGDDNAVTVDGGFTVDEIAEQLKSFEAIIDSFWKQMPTTMQFMMAVSRQNETQSALLLVCIRHNSITN